MGHANQVTGFAAPLPGTLHAAHPTEPQGLRWSGRRCRGPVSERHIGTQRALTRRYARARLVRASATTSSPAEEPAVASAPPAYKPPLYDVVVIGGGPAGLSLSAGLGARGVRTLCCDATLDKPWPNNYGTWVDELEPLGLQDCVTHIWEKSSAFVRPDGAKSELQRAYARVDRIKLKDRLIEKCTKSGNVEIVRAAASAVDNSHTEFTTVVFEDQNDFPPVSGRIIVDATGHKLKFVQFEDGKVPGFQAAYGIECTVSEASYPYAADEMLLMDFRDDHMKESNADRQQSQTRPTFIYVMPLDNGEGRRVFFEETSLVASPAMPFDELKERLYKRLSHYNVEVQDVHEEEFCLIPMGGSMPELRQRIVAFGGAAALVHPATGYMIARALWLADQCAGIIASELKSSSRSLPADAMAHRVWDRLWNVGRRRQRDFFNFGGEYLQRLDLDTTRDFFSAFFDLPKEQWSDFLSFRLIQPMERLVFGLGVFARTTNRVRTTIVPASLMYGGWKLLVSVLPFYTAEENEIGRKQSP